jgi:hypothetical protein
MEITVKSREACQTNIFNFYIFSIREAKQNAFLDVKTAFICDELSLSSKYLVIKYNSVLRVSSCTYVLLISLSARFSKNDQKKTIDSNIVNL